MGTTALLLGAPCQPQSLRGIYEAAQGFAGTPVDNKPESHRW